MPSRIDDLFQNSYYHVYNRGFNKQKLFLDKDDYVRFYKTIQRYLIDYPSVRITHFCFLPNHFHFLLWETSESQDFSEGFHNQITSDLIDENLEVQAQSKLSKEISHFMRKIQQSYAMYFNERYKKTVKKGLKMPMFEGRFQAREVLDQAYLEQLGDYIEGNAVKHGLVEDPKDWPYSSFSIDSPNLPKSGLGGEDFDPIFE